MSAAISVPIVQMTVITGSIFVSTAMATYCFGKLFVRKDSDGEDFGRARLERRLRQTRAHYV